MIIKAFVDVLSESFECKSEAEGQLDSSVGRTSTRDGNGRKEEENES